jgi:hypothetical protein
VPDAFGFNHLPHHGTTYHTCSVCNEYGWGVIVSVKERERHHARHVRERARETERAREASLRKARQALRQKGRENDIAYGEET